MKRGFLLFIITIFLSLFPVSAYTKSFSIQTATYALNARGYAERHFNFVKGLISERPELKVRLLKGKRYLVIRVGDFREYEEAKEFAKGLKTILNDPFILETEKSGFELLRVFPEPVKEEVKGDVEKKAPLQSPSRTERAIKEKKPQARVVYTVELATFSRVREAIGEFNRIKGIVHPPVVKTLRIERHANHYSLRIGAFSSYEEARQFLQSYKERLKGIIIQAMYSSKGVVLSYQDTEKVSEQKEGATDREAEEVERVIVEVEQRLGNENFGEAAELLREAVRRWPENPELHALYGETLLNMGFAKNAYREYKRAIEISPDVSQYHSGLGYSLLNIYIERAQQAIDAFKKALEIDPENVDALEGLGTVYVSIDRRDLAEDIYNRLKELDPVAAKRLRDVIDSGLEIGR
ncbi:MAG: hypothetical protein D6710_09000 [Nitrospirae bacterium]|nr:MAG: hypothetical protein D6710_09000 [Nitrospirota bacterium]